MPLTKFIHVRSDGGTLHTILLKTTAESDDGEQWPSLPNALRELTAIGWRLGLNFTASNQTNVSVPDEIVLILVHDEQNDQDDMARQIAKLESELGRAESIVDKAAEREGRAQRGHDSIRAAADTLTAKTEQRALRERLAALRGRYEGT